MPIVHVPSMCARRYSCSAEHFGCECDMHHLDMLRPKEATPEVAARARPMGRRMLQTQGRN
jgi:hypothetical protein